jgi:hypothetical protein
MYIVPVPPRSTDSLDGVLDANDRRRFDAALKRQRHLLGGRRL